MQMNICGLILRVSYPSMGDTSKSEVLGKTMLEWVKLSLMDSFFCAIDYDENIPLPLLIKPYVNKESEYTVVLYSDTPLITRKTVLDAVFDLQESGENVLKMTRGYVFKTAYLLEAEKIYGTNHRFFDEEDFITAFSFKQTAMISEILRGRINSYHMLHGVQFDDPVSAFISCDAIIEKNVRIGTSCIIKGKTIIKENSFIENTTLETAVIDEGCTIKNSVITDSYIGSNTTVGPFAHIRNKTKIGNDCRIGNFVEIKNSIINSKTKIAHLSYVGDADIGTGCNIGAGTVFCNYDGKNKHRTVLGDDVFVGSNSSLVAPLRIENGALIAAGSAITDDIPKNKLAFARARQVLKDKKTRLE